MAKTKSKAPERPMTEKDLIARGMYDPRWWMNRCGWTMWEKQIEICEALITHDRVAVPAAFGVGKTWVAARISLWWLYTHYPSIVVTTAPTGRQVRDLLWAEIRDGHYSSKLPLGGEVLTTEIRMAPKWFATGFATNEEHMDKFTGYHSPNMLLIFDQACGIHKQIWSAGEGLLTSANCKWLALSNTTDEKSEMANICMHDRRSDYGAICEDPNCPGCNKWKVIKIRAYDSPNVIARENIFPGILNYDYVEKKKQVWRPGDPLWEVYIEANFVEAGAMTVLHPTMTREILETNRIEPDFNNIRIAIDVGDEGSDPTVAAVACGGRLGFIERVLGNDPMKVVAFVEEVWKKTIRLTGNEAVAIYVDIIGVGSGVASRLSEKGYPVIGINVGRKPMDDEKYINQRIEMAWRIRELAEAHALDWRPLYSTEEVLLDLLREDMGIRYKPLPSQKIKLEDKLDFRRRMRRSSDLWDAMCMAFADNGDIPGISAITSLEPEMRYRDIAKEWSTVDLPDSDAQFKLLQKLFARGYMEESDFGPVTEL